MCATEYQRRKEQSSKKQILCPHAGAEAGNNIDPSHQNTENYPTTVSLTVCANIYKASISDKIKSPRYRVVQGIISSNCRLHTVQFTCSLPTYKCHHFDPVIHCLTILEVAGAIWRWMCSKVQLVTRINSRFPVGDWYDPNAQTNCGGLDSRSHNLLHNA